ncbi:MAG: helix-turn-helix transcriptional regulator [Actinobacteria bacterium]|nr:helix-turn-helix transcriptional regulator [Actinomycetota bacterium]
MTRVTSVPDPEEYLPLPLAQFHILAALSGGELHGYVIMQTVEESSHGLVRMGPATLYGTLKKLVGLGLVKEVARRPTSGDDARRRYYELSGLGRSVCAAEADRLSVLAARTRRNLRPGLT